MAVFTIQKHVEAPPHGVFHMATDFANAPRRIKGIKRVEMLTDGPVRIGTRFRETRVMFKREATEEMQVTAFDPPRRYELGCESCGCRYRTEFRLTPNGTGTEVEMRFEATPLTLVARVMGFLMRPMIRMCMKAIEKDFDDLKTAAESQAAGKASAGAAP